MNTKTISMLFVLFSLVSSAVMIPIAYADHPIQVVSMPQDSSARGCEKTDMCFIPPDVTIDVGAEVTWTNDDSAVHTVTSGSASEGPDDIFNSYIVTSGSEYTFKFEDAGNFDYFCLVHPWMEGTVTVGMAHDDMRMYDDFEIPNTTPVMMMSQDNNYVVNVYPIGEPATGEMFSFVVEVTDSDGNSAEHLNYDLMVMQDGNSVFEDGADLHSHSGAAEHMTTMLDSDSPVDVMVTLQGFGPGSIDTRTGPIGETVGFNVVPEFGTIAILVFAVAIISIVAITTKSNINLIPRI